MSRYLTDHQVNPANDQLKIQVMDQPGSGGANHHYRIFGFSTQSNTSASAVVNNDETALDILFQNRPIGEFGVNGITQEAIIAICIDRLRSFQSGPYACRDNEIALTKLEEAQMWLLKRTRDRMARGVEGTYQE